jgi:hypothetical protein
LRGDLRRAACRGIVRFGKGVSPMTRWRIWRLEKFRRNPWRPRGSRLTGMG